MTSNPEIGKNPTGWTNLLQGLPITVMLLIKLSLMS